MLTAERIDSHNTFDAPDRVIPAPFEPFTIGQGAAPVLPPRSATVLELQ